MAAQKQHLQNAAKPNVDYTDSFVYEFHDPRSRIGITQVAEAFCQPGPRWVESLLALRHRIVGIFGLKGEVPAEEQGTPRTGAAKWEPGAQAGMFKVFGISDDAIILGEDDKHLDFRVTVHLTPDMPHTGKKQATVTTTVTIHNLLGKSYFFFIKPFHRVIVPAMLKRNFGRLEADLYAK